MAEPQDKKEGKLTESRPDAIVDWKLYVKHNIAHADAANAAFFANPANQGHLASQLLLYEHVVIPTNDFAIIPALVNWMGLGAFEEALDASAISFQRRLGILGYAGNGAGLIAFGINDTPEKPFEQWWRRTLFGDPAEAVELHVRHGAPRLNSKDRDRIITKVISASVTPDVNSDSIFDRDVVRESYQDIRDTPELKAAFGRLAIGAGARSGQPIAVNHAPGIEPNAVEIPIEGEAQTPAQLVLRVGEVNLEIVLAGLAGGTDLHVSEGTEKLLYHKIVRSGAGRNDAFARVLELNGIPDIRRAVETSSVGLSEIWEIRQERPSTQFRKWLAKAETHSSTELERLYIESLEKVSHVDSVPGRVLRLVLTTALGLINPIAGVAASTVDSFFVSRYLKGYRPKLMFDRLGKLFAEPSQGR